MSNKENTQGEAPKLRDIYESNSEYQGEPRIKWRVIAIDIYNRVFIEDITSKKQAVSFWDAPDFLDKFNKVSNNYKLQFKGQKQN